MLAGLSYTQGPAMGNGRCDVDATGGGPAAIRCTTVQIGYSLLRTREAGFGLPCLNHACDATSKVMNDLFGG